MKPINGSDKEAEKNYQKLYENTKGKDGNWDAYIRMIDHNKIMIIFLLVYDLSIGVRLRLILLLNL